MTNTMKFGRKLNLPSIVQIKHQLLTFWLKDQTEKEAAEALTSARTSADKTSADKTSAPHLAVAVLRAPE